MLILHVLKDKISLFWGILAMAIAFLWPAIPLRGLDVWFKTLTSLFPTNVGYPILVILIGIYTALYVYNKRNPEVCPVRKEKTGFFASLGGILLGACPACIPALAFFLPLSFTITLSYYSWLFLSIAIIFLIFAIWQMGGFKKI